jgi:uncharacterized damage-inducible protein DinB
MDKTGLIELCGYTDDANGLLLGVARGMTTEELNCSSSPSHGSVMGLLQHMLDAEAYFLSICQGHSSSYEREEKPTFEELVKNWERVAEERKAYVASVDENELQEKAKLTFGSKLAFPRGQLMLQSLIHSVHHRGELSIVMTGLGHPLPTLDIILHFARESGQPWP